MLLFEEEDDGLLLPNKVALLDFEEVVHLVRVEDTAGPVISAEHISCACVPTNGFGSNNNGGRVNDDRGTGPSPRERTNCIPPIPVAHLSPAWRHQIASGGEVQPWTPCA
jgi:hypothetical protein